MSISYFVLNCLYFFLPAYLCNMTPPLLNKAGFLKFLAKPIDFSRKFKGEPILGQNKTWRGVLLGIFIGILVAYLQSFLYKFSFFQRISVLNYTEINILFFGFLISGGAVFGDLLFSFFKRRLNKKPGQKWFPFDQIDYVIGSFLFLTLFFKINFSIWGTLLILTLFLHIIVTRLGFWFKLTDSKW